MDTNTVSIGDGGADAWQVNDKPMAGNAWLDDDDQTDALTSQQNIWKKLQTFSRKTKPTSKGE